MKLLKEWDVVCRALEEGRQILLARKGGILDDGGLFVPSFREFFLYPTYLHQSEQVREALKPSELMRYGPDVRPLPISPPETVAVRLFVRIDESYQVTDLAAIKRLNAEHIWQSSFLEKRFEWGSERGLTLLAARAYAVDPTALLPVKPSFAGCRSWIEDPDFGTQTDSLRPILSDEAFLKRKAALKRALRK